jgi:ATP/maltotriose-dependent transcriptional regulator MalT
MRLDAGPLKIRIEAEGPSLAELLARAEEEGFALALPGEEADLAARPASAASPPRRDAARLGEGASSPLSPRELEILGYLVDGWSNAEIASVLRIGLRTVRFHLEGIYGKLGVARRGEAAREALRLGLVRFEV